MGVDNVIQGEEDRAEVTQPLGLDVHGRREACIETSGYPCCTIVRPRVLIKVHVNKMLYHRERNGVRDVPEVQALFKRRQRNTRSKHARADLRARGCCRGYEGHIRR